jgi:hypothetical protein
LVASSSYAKPVTTSGRRVRAYTARELLGTLARLWLALPLGGSSGVRGRDGVAGWYTPRRDDPEG